MSPETGTFISMDTYSGTLDNPVSLHKYLYANANLVMYTDPTGYFSIMETQLAQTIKSTIQSASVPAMNFHKIMSWANMAVTAYDIGCQLRLFISGDGNLLGLVWAIARGMIVQSVISCGLTAVFGKSATLILKLVGIKQDTESLFEAVKGGNLTEIIFESLRLVVSIYTLKCQCFTGDTLVSTVDGDRRIDEIQTGDYIWSNDTETGEKVKAKVTNVSVTEADVLVHVYTDDGEEIKTTMFHPFYVKGKDVADNEDISYNSGEWKAASNLSAGDELLTEDGKIVHVKEVRIERLEERIKVYNLEVEGLHTYYVGEGVLVHNMCVVESDENLFDFSEVVSQSELSKSQFDALTYEGVLSGGGRSGNNLPKTNTQNSYYITDKGHVIIYGKDGYRVMDISAERIKIQKYNVNPNNNLQGSWSSRKLKDASGQVEKTVQWILDYFGI